MLTILNRPRIPRSIQIGRYLTLRTLRTHERGTLYLARGADALSIPRLVLLRTARFGSAAAAELLDDAHIGKMVHHVNVARVIDSGCDAEQAFVAVEHIDGVDLDVVFDAARVRGRQPPFGVACRIIADLLAGLSRLHSAAAAGTRLTAAPRRTPSPAGVLLTLEGKVKLLETAAAAQNPYRSITSVGLLLWELATGRRAEGEEIADASCVNPIVPATLDRVIRRALTPTRAPDATALQSEIEALIAAERWSAGRDLVSRYVRTLTLPLPKSIHI